MKPQDLTRIGLCVALTSVLALISVPIPFSPVPITLSVAAVLISGLVLTPQQALLSQFAYLLIAALGVPVLAGFSAGIPAIVGPTGGYLMAYPLMAYVVSLSQQLKIEDKRLQVIAFLASEVFAMLICYVLGTMWLAHSLQITISRALVLAVYPYLIGDALKVAFVFSLHLTLKRTLSRARG